MHQPHDVQTPSSLSDPISRRSAVQGLVLTGVTLTLSTQAQQVEPRVALEGLDQLEQDWDVLEFEYDGEPSLVVRVPVPEKGDERPLKVGQDTKATYLVAYTRTCRHLGCIPTLPDAQGEMVCPCHGSTYRAADGGLLKGPATRGLMGLTLALEGTRVFVTGRFELRG